MDIKTQSIPTVGYEWGYSILWVDDCEVQIDRYLFFTDGFIKYFNFGCKCIDIQVDIFSNIFQMMYSKFIAI